MRALDGNPVNPSDLCHLTFARILYVILWGKNLHKDDPDLKLIETILELEVRGLLMTPKGLLLDVFSWLKHFNIEPYALLQEDNRQKMVLFKRWKENIKDVVAKKGLN